MKKWKCSICGYIHTGDEPPEKCPVCGADRSKFVELTSESEESGQFVHEDKTPEPDVTPASAAADEIRETIKPPKKPDYKRIYDFVGDLVLQHHMHPISVHIPNGLIPISVFFAFMAVFFQLTNFEIASYYNMVFVLLAMPVVLFTGYVEWQKHYGGSRTSIFLTKIICGIIVFVSALIIVFWRISDPAIATSASSSRWMFFLIHMIMLSAAGFAGYLGGKLVFKD